MDSKHDPRSVAVGEIRIGVKKIKQALIKRDVFWDDIDTSSFYTAVINRCIATLPNPNTSCFQHILCTQTSQNSSKLNPKCYWLFLFLLISDCNPCTIMCLSNVFKYQEKRNALHVTSGGKPCFAWCCLSQRFLLPCPVHTVNATSVPVNWLTSCVSYLGMLRHSFRRPVSLATT